MLYHMNSIYLSKHHVLNSCQCAFKIKSFGISGDLLELIRNFLSNRFERVVLNEQISECKKKYWSVTGLNSRTAVFA